MKKALIITYYWPPAGGPGVQRWLKFVKYLPDFDIEPVVFIPENPDYPIMDKSLESEISPKLKIIKNPIFEPYKIASFFSKKETKTISSGLIAEEKKQGFLQKLLLFIRGNFFIPDARKFWVKPSVDKISDLLEVEKFDVVITTGPPHSVHLIGLQLKKIHGINWIADFRDPWTNIGYHSKLKLLKFARRKHKQLEQEVLDKADQLLVTSFQTQEEFRSKTTTPVALITNGYDSEIFPKKRRSEKFKISHIGSLLSGRNPENLWKAISELIHENKDFKEQVSIELAGRVSEEVIRSIIDFNLFDYLNSYGYLSHKQAVELQRASDILLLLEINSVETKGIIPGKIFEYLAAQNPILAIGPRNWDVNKIVSETKAGQVFQYNEKEEIKHFILSHFEGINISENSHPKIEEYHRKRLTRRLSELIKSF
ncbi:glycosyltransferase family 4 protein [Gramella sp. AN32]|uniref:Glycosyltransferase family 4 protein n=1 Tax=Christiangramia antarctica TaxID=2058158 RepID=A0ABW5X6B7_9FLAO|nr:glycosyltransferase family 4 protein [Gramella sp. AN32]MCM4156070.1 glycosyl transferase family 1 [Gramella sp. AN32]